MDPESLLRGRAAEPVESLVHSHHDYFWQERRCGEPDERLATGPLCGYVDRANGGSAGRAGAKLEAQGGIEPMSAEPEAFRRVVWVVLDSVGIGAMPDAADYGDVGSDTLGNTARRRNLNLPNRAKLGLGNPQTLPDVDAAARPTAPAAPCALCAR